MSNLESGDGSGVRVSELGTRAHSLRSGPAAVNAADKHSEHSVSNTRTSRPRLLFALLSAAVNSQPSTLAAE